MKRENLRMKTIISLAMGFAIMVFGATAHAATITFTVTSFSNTLQLAAAGTLVEAVHFGDAGGATITANGLPARRFRCRNRVTAGSEVASTMS